MRKLFLLTATVLVGFSSVAQVAGPLSISGGSTRQDIQPFDIGTHRPSAKSTISGSRWYNHAGMVDEYLTNGLMDMAIFPIWFDSTIKQVFNTGLGTINYSSVAQVVDPFGFTLWNDPNLVDPTMIAIEPESPYKIDSISFFGFYVENVNRPLTIVDTLIISVSMAGNTGTPVYSIGPSEEPKTWQNGYACQSCPDSTVYGVTVSPVDAVNRASAVNGVARWKVLIDSSMRRPDSSGVVFGREFTYPVMVGGVPGSLDIPAGRRAAVTITFKTGDVHNPGDSIDKYNRMYIHTGQGMGVSTFMPYYYYSHRDRNMSNNMFSTDPTYYAPSIFIEMSNTADFFREFHNISTHITCANCPTVAEYASVHNVNSAVATDMSAFPNPANNEINVSFSMNQKTDAKVYITDAVGKLIATQQVGVAANQVNKVTFSTAGLSAGIYFYTVEAKGQRTTNRFVVSH